MRIATFNVQNMRLRHGAGGAHLDGARDADAPVGLTEADPRLDTLDRRLTAAVVAAVNADILALQEVFDLETLAYFHDRFLRPGGCPPYPHRICLPGNDGRGLNVALLSRLAPTRITSHANDTATDLGIADPPDAVGTGPVFRRDCLEVDVGGVTVFVCHFKAPYPDRRRSQAIRHTEAAAVRRIIERRFADPASAAWVILGDLNEPATAAALAPLRGGFAVDLMARLPPDDDWTLSYAGGIHTRPDAILFSPALAAAFPDACPRIFRAGLDPTAAQDAGGAFDTVRTPRPHASDHAAVYVDLGGS